MDFGHTTHSRSYPLGAWLGGIPRFFYVCLQCKTCLLFQFHFVLRTRRYTALYICWIVIRNVRQVRDHGPDCCGGELIYEKYVRINSEHQHFFFTCRGIHTASFLFILCQFYTKKNKKVHARGSPQQAEETASLFFFLLLLLSWGSIQV